MQCRGQFLTVVGVIKSVVEIFKTCLTPFFYVQALAMESQIKLNSGYFDDRETKRLVSSLNSWREEETFTDFKLISTEGKQFSVKIIVFHFSRPNRRNT